LHLAGTAYEAVIDVYCNRLAVFEFVNADWAGVYACTASIAFFKIDFYFNHDISSPSLRVKSTK
jgi:hypothetical protein